MCGVCVCVCGVCVWCVCVCVCGVCVWCGVVCLCVCVWCVSVCGVCGVCVCVCVRPRAYKFATVHTIKVCRGIEGIVPSIFVFDILCK